MIDIFGNAAFNRSVTELNMLDAQRQWASAQYDQYTAVTKLYDHAGQQTAVFHGTPEEAESYRQGQIVALRRRSLDYNLRHIIESQNPVIKEQYRMAYLKQKIERRKALRTKLFLDRLQVIGLWWAAAVGALLGFVAFTELVRLAVYVVLR